MGKNNEKVLCSIPTKNRYDMLAHAIQAVIMQTRKPDHLMIFDDGQHQDLRNHAVYKHLFVNLDQVGISWEVVFLEGKGQHHAHQIANKKDEFDLVWRIDDDTIAEPNVLEGLLALMNPSVGAAGGAVVTPGQEQGGGTNKIVDLFDTPNIQWKRGKDVRNVEHLYSSFVYRTGIANYELSLSPVAHREETIFSHEIFRAGFKLMVDTSLTTWHYRQETGGIRSHQDNSMYMHDEMIFFRRMEEWGYKIISMNTGLGDHLAFLNIVPELKKKHKKLILAVCYPHVFEGISDLKILPYACIGKKVEDSVYKWMAENNWQGHIVDAYRKIYL